ncbi:acyl-CoA-binding domain-containing protein 6 [Ischnura elegans]|uniref:acyl-CoA-binding domain-containing protein 6 n=1 Tax=Ischnura elegans TaxID=197161 RepID=UPI001ED8A8E2|nr:acyl-CoA-binding domain-containing protein 6 [Ischnura elegans]
MAYSPSSDLLESFEHAASLVRSLSAKLDTEVLLKLYAHYKQATVGPCQSSSSFTSWFGPNKMKQDAWKSLGGMSKEEAMRGYICLVASAVSSGDKKESVQEDVEDNESDELEGSDESEGEKQGKFGWVRVSRPAISQDSACSPSDEDKSLIDWAKDENLVGFADSLKISTLEEINKVDESGMTALHWAADRGHAEAVQLLLDAGALANGKDLEGQTPLHYAASCGHKKVAQILIKAGSDPEAVNSDGERPVDLACGEDITELFQKPHVNAH